MSDHQQKPSGLNAVRTQQHMCCGECPVTAGVIHQSFQADPTIDITSNDTPLLRYHSYIISYLNPLSFIAAISCALMCMHVLLLSRRQGVVVVIALV